MHDNNVPENNLPTLKQCYLRKRPVCIHCSSWILIKASNMILQSSIMLYPINLN